MLIAVYNTELTQRVYRMASDLMGPEMLALPRGRWISLGRRQWRSQMVVDPAAAAGPDGFRGGLRAANYRTITDAAPATATRDLAELVALGAMRKEGNGSIRGIA